MTASVQDQRDLALRGEQTAADPAEVDRLVETLRVAGQWLTAAECNEWMANGEGAKPGSDRKIRALAAAAGARVVSWPGSPGYRYFGHATIDEVQHAIRATRQQANEMMKKVVAWETAYNKRGLF